MAVFRRFLCSTEIVIQTYKYLSALLVFSFRLYKEYEDAYREAWSARDMAVDALGILSAMYDRPGAKVLCTYDQEKIMLNLVFTSK
jgi:hypothetical protein